jgi:ABC-type multidrug transport system fused ATPase/permease subunit
VYEYGLMQLIVLDECTASCDGAVDTHIQSVIRVALADRTVICIAYSMG